MSAKYNYNSLEDFLISTTLTVDGQIDDGWGALFPVKGREIEATILFSDISGFSKRTSNLNATETLIFVNHFFAWITAEALCSKKGIVDKYIGDEMMMVFSRRFGSDDPFKEAVEAARFMAENDAYSFCPHIGIASGQVIVGYVGTPMKYNCSVFGSPVALASRCASVKTAESDNAIQGCSIVFPADEWGSRDFDKVFPTQKYRNLNGTTFEQPHAWNLKDPRVVEMKNLPDIQIQEIILQSMHFPQESPEERARTALQSLKETNRYWPEDA
nr:putative uncharacterized protein [uncultured bacterium]